MRTRSGLSATSKECSCSQDGPITGRLDAEPRKQQAEVEGDPDGLGHRGQDERTADSRTPVGGITNDLETRARDVVDALEIDHDAGSARHRVGNGIAEQACGVTPEATRENQDVNIARSLYFEFKR